MKSIVKKTIFTGLGLIKEGTDAVKQMGEELAKKAEKPEAEGKKIAVKLQAQSAQTLKTIKKTIDEKTTQVAGAIHKAMKEEPSKPAAKSKAKTSKPAAKAKPAPAKPSPKKPAPKKKP